MGDKDTDNDKDDEDEEITGLRQKLADLEAAIVRQDRPLGAFTRAITLAKSAKLRQRIKELER